jgi:hypothetical protein
MGIRRRSNSPTLTTASAPRAKHMANSSIVEPAEVHSSGRMSRLRQMTEPAATFLNCRASWRAYPSHSLIGVHHRIADYLHPIGGNLERVCQIWHALHQNGEVHATLRSASRTWKARRANSPG